MPDDTRDEVVAYEDGDAVVLCDPENPAAWIRSDTTVTVTAVKRDRTPLER